MRVDTHLSAGLRTWCTRRVVVIDARAEQSRERILPTRGTRFVGIFILARAAHVSRWVLPVARFESAAAVISRVNFSRAPGARRRPADRERETPHTHDRGSACGRVIADGTRRAEDGAARAGGRTTTSASARVCGLTVGSEPSRERAAGENNNTKNKSLRKKPINRHRSPDPRPADRFLRSVGRAAPAVVACGARVSARFGEREAAGAGAASRAGGVSSHCNYHSLPQELARTLYRCAHRGSARRASPTTSTHAGGRTGPPGPRERYDLA